MTQTEGTTRLGWRGAQEALADAEMRLTEIMVPAADAVSLIKDDPVEADAHSGWTLLAYFETAPDMETVRTALDGLPLDAPERETLEDRDWVAEALEGLGVVQAGAFLLYGSHDADKIDGMNGFPLLVEANRAFGTGHHPTTAGCLEALTRLRDLNPQNVLDVGTGSGVLAMAARRLWAQADILGTDIDAPSVAIALENSHENGIEDIRYFEATGISPEVAEDGPYDLILANILAEPLMGLAPDIAASLSAHGRVVLAGLLARQEQGVINAYAAAGLTVIDRVNDDTWPVLVVGRT